MTFHAVISVKHSILYKIERIPDGAVAHLIVGLCQLSTLLLNDGDSWGLQVTFVLQGCVK